MIIYTTCLHGKLGLVVADLESRADTRFELDRVEWTEYRGVKRVCYVSSVNAYNVINLIVDCIVRRQVWRKHKTSKAMVIWNFIVVRWRYSCTGTQTIGCAISM